MWQAPADANIFYKLITVFQYVISLFLDDYKNSSKVATEPRTV
jgi:hypothetical protein